MVQLDVRRSAGGVADMFRGRDYANIIATGGLATVGLALSGMLGATIADTLGVRDQSSGYYIIVSLAAILGGMAAVNYLGRGIGGGIAIGSSVVVGVSLLSILAGPTPEVPTFRKLSDGLGSSFSMPFTDSAGGSGREKRVVDPPSAEPGDIRSVSQTRRAESFR